MRGISWLAEELLASQVGLCSMKFVLPFYYITGLTTETHNVNFVADVSDASDVTIFRLEWLGKIFWINIIAFILLKMTHNTTSWNVAHCMRNTLYKQAVPRRERTDKGMATNPEQNESWQSGLQAKHFLLTTDFSPEDGGSKLLRNIDKKTHATRCNRTNVSYDTSYSLKYRPWCTVRTFYLHTLPALVLYTDVNAIKGTTNLKPLRHGQ
jgi:hypothetical protein